jgi:hypothetical protein
MKAKTSLAQLWWADNHPLHNVELFSKYYPNMHYSNIKDNHIEYIYKKEVKPNENK